MYAHQMDYESIPYDRHAEHCLIGQLILGQFTPEALTLSPGDFVDPKIKTIYESCVAVHNLGVTVDIVSITHNLNARGVMDAAGGNVNLADLMGCGGGPRLVPHYVREIKKHSVERTKIKAFENASNLYADGRLDDAFRHIQTKLHALEIVQDVKAPIVNDMGDLLNSHANRIKKALSQPGALPGTPSGFFELDRATGGFRNDNLVIIAGRPGMGKTCMATSISIHVAGHYTLPVVIFSLEMSKDDLVDRLVASVAKVDSQKMDLGELTVNDLWEIDKAREKIAGWPIQIVDCLEEEATAAFIRDSIERLEVKPRLVIVDYLGRMDAEEDSFSKNDELEKTTWQLKKSARALQIPHILLCQLSRAVEGRAVKRPQLTDLRDSGGIEINADVVLLLHRDEYHRPNDTTKRGTAEIIIAKNRKGPVKDVEVRFQADQQLFSDINERWHRLQTREEVKSA